MFIGYRESVNMSQVRTFIEMDSHEERVFQAVRQTQEREAKQKMMEKAKELSKLQKTQALAARSAASSLSSSTAMGSGPSDPKPELEVGSRAMGAQPPPPITTARPKGSSRAMKLGQKSQKPLDEQMIDWLVDMFI